MPKARTGRKPGRPPGRRPRRVRRCFWIDPEDVALLSRAAALDDAHEADVVRASLKDYCLRRIAAHAQAELVAQELATIETQVAAGPARPVRCGCGCAMDLVLGVVICPRCDAPLHAAS